MRKSLKRTFSLMLVLCLCLAMLPLAEVAADAATGLSLAQLRQKFPHGKYWNHAGNPGSSNSVNNQNGYTSTPCSQHGVVGTSKQTCNGFQPGNAQLSWQCMGYAEKLGYDATGYNPRSNANGWHTYTVSSALDNLKPGDIVRYKSNGHSIYVTGVNGDTVTYTDCNSDGHCVIRWDATIKKSTLKSSFTHVRSAPSAVTPGTDSCSCSASHAGTYVCTTSSLNLTIRSGHGSSYSAIGSIPSGATVTVSKASGTGSGDWAHVTYNGVSGYASMQYLARKQTAPQRDSKIGLWMSDTAMGEAISSIRTGEWLYFCYKLYDANTGALLDTYNTSGGYTARMNLYGPDGSLAHTYTYDNDNNWISIRRNEPGKYKGELVFNWNSGGTTTSTVTIDMVYEPRVTPSVSDIQLNVTGTDSQTISISYSGVTLSNSIYLNCDTTGDCFSYKWGSWTDHKMPLTITGVRGGQGSITIKMFDTDTNEVIATSKVYVTVTAPTYTVSYHANGGTGAPGSQTKPHNTTLKLSSTRPTRSGYTFQGWATNSSATSASYQPSGDFTANQNTTLYAVWKRGCDNNSHSYSYGVTKTPTTSASGTLTGTCTRCSATTTVTLPKLSTTDYTYSVRTAATCTANGTGRYTWKTTGYGTFTFDVTISKVGHSYSYGVTKTPTTSASGTLTGTCTKCKGTTTVTLPKLNTTDYSYSVKSAATCSTTGTGTYTWKTTGYGTFTFDVTLSKTGHSYTHQVTAATCTAGGYTTHTCTLCGDRYKDGHTNALGHRYSGETCTRCGAKDPNYVVDTNTAQVVLDSKTASKGSTVSVDLKVLNNPGFSVLNVAIIYDREYLTLTSVENKATSMVMTHNESILWDAAADHSADGVLATLNFAVAKDAPEGDYEIRVVFMGASNEDFEDVRLAGVSGVLKVLAGVYGDANGDGQVTTVDLAMLRKYLSGMNPITGASDVAVKAGADCNGDGTVNTVDLAMLRKYLSGKNPVTGESSVVLGPK